MNWIPITDENMIDEIITTSREMMCLVFKHSNSCEISHISKWRLENSWTLPATEVRLYFLDLLKYRPISNKIAEVFNVYHESPQVLLIRNGECIYESSHLDINTEEIELCYKEVTII
jgi:bacillithiol system protein YtxJ